CRRSSVFLEQKGWWALPREAELRSAGRARAPVPTRVVAASSGVVFSRGSSAKDEQELLFLEAGATGWRRSGRGVLLPCSLRLSLCMPWRTLRLRRFLATMLYLRW